VEIEVQIKTNDLPAQGIFMDGQVFDAYELTSRIIRSAKQRIVLIDNYIDEQTFTQWAKKEPHVQVLILTKTSISGENTASKQLGLDLKKANEQYGNFEVIPYSKSHDRFLTTVKHSIGFFPIFDSFNILKDNSRIKYAKIFSTQRRSPGGALHQGRPSPDSHYPRYHALV
jgi:hypothetical protein